jgi:hypothetical protein
VLYPKGVDLVEKKADEGPVLSAKREAVAGGDTGKGKKPAWLKL